MDLKDLIKTLRAAGVTHYKTADLELTLAPQEPQRRRRRVTPEEEEEIKHKTEEMSSLMKLSDQDLVDRLFPEPTDDLEALQ